MFGRDVFPSNTTKIVQKSFNSKQSNNYFFIERKRRRRRRRKRRHTQASAHASKRTRKRTQAQAEHAKGKKIGPNWGLSSFGVRGPYTRPTAAIALNNASTTSETFGPIDSTRPSA